jgi:hypothetical protein
MVSLAPCSPTRVFPQRPVGIPFSLPPAPAQAGPHVPTSCAQPSSPPASGHDEPPKVNAPLSWRPPAAPAPPLVPLASSKRVVFHGDPSSLRRTPTCIPTGPPCAFRREAWRRGWWWRCMRQGCHVRRTVLKLASWLAACLLQTSSGFNWTHNPSSELPKCFSHGKRSNERLCGSPPVVSWRWP